MTVPERNSDLTATFATLSTHTTKLRIAMQEALEKVLPLSSGARACGRALGLKRSLGWQVYALANASDAATTLRALPRVQGWDFILQAFARSGCPARELNALRAEAKALESFLRLSRIDRDLLRAAACGGLDSARETNAMLRARRPAPQPRIRPRRSFFGKSTEFMTRCPTALRYRKRRTSAPFPETAVGRQ